MELSPIFYSLNLDDISDLLWEEIEKQNSSPHPDCEGISPNQMCIIRTDPFHPESLLNMKPLYDKDLKEIWLLQIALMIIKAVDNPRGLKLTDRGSLPVSLIKQIKESGLVHEEIIESRIHRLYREHDSEWITIAHILLKLSGIIKKRDNILSLTQAGKAIISDNNLLLRKLIETHMLRFNWGYFDNFICPYIGKLNSGFSLFLLLKYGNVSRPEFYYAEKYIKASQMLLNEVTDSPYITFSDKAYLCYSTRTFSRFLRAFNLISIRHNNSSAVNNQISVRPVYYRLLELRK